MKSSYLCCVVVLVAVGIAVARASAVTVWNEAINGPLGDGVGPATPLGVLSLPTSEIFGAAEHQYLGNENYVTIGDYFTFSVPDGFEITSIQATVARPDLWAWIGTPDFNSTLGWTLSAATGDLISQWGSSPIHGGPFGMYLSHHERDQATSSSPYALSFQFGPYVPEPATIVLLGPVVLGMRGRKHGHRARRALT
jgi:hypothetical protein